MVSKCIVDAKHRGPISRRGFCKRCALQRMRQGGALGGRTFRKSFHMAPSTQSKHRRATEHAKVRRRNKTVLQSMWGKSRKPKRMYAQVGGTKHRCCFRCGQRRDRCVDDGCVPYAFEVDKHAYSKLVIHFDRFMHQEGGIRTTTDCFDVQIMKAWAIAARCSYGIRTSVLGLIVGAHFKSIRTWGAINHSFRIEIDWLEFKNSLIKCGHLWGNLTAANKQYALYSGTCMSGKGLSPCGRNYHDRFVRHFQFVLQSNSFDKVCKLLVKGIDSFEKTHVLLATISVLRKEVSGLLGVYHYKMFLDYLVACDWLPAKWVSEYPVCLSGGTAEGLDKIFPGHGRGAVQYANMLNELTHRVMMSSKTWCATDHQGTVGAALCWASRLLKSSSSQVYGSRFEETGVVI